MRKMLILLLGIAAFFGGISRLDIKASTTPLTTEFTDQKIIWLGDSLTSGHGASTVDDKFVNIVSTKLGFSSFVNYGVGSSTIAILPGTSISFLDRYEAMDNDADVIVVMGGVNDMFEQVTIGTSDSVNNQEFYGALNELLPALKTKYPTGRIIIAGPMKTIYGVPTDYNTALKNRASQYGLEYIDLLNYSNLDFTDINNKAIYSTDGVHLNDEGNRRIADIFISYLYKDATPNLFNISNLVEDMYWYTTGEASSIYFYHSGLIEIEENRTYYIPSASYADNRVFVVFFDESQTPIGDARNIYMFVKSPLNAKYMVVNFDIQYDSATIDISKIINYDYQLVLNTNGGTVIENILHNELNEPVIPIPTNTGYSFVGWYRDTGLTEPFSLVLDTVEGDTTLYAKWVLNTSTGGGSIIIDNAGNFTNIDYIIMGGVGLLLIVIFGSKKKKGKWS